MVRLEAGDCLAVVPRLAAEGVRVDAIVTDPPYHLQGAGMLTGFMGKAWDGGDVAFRPETWAAIAAVLRPGGFLLAFGGTRTHHRIWSAIEDAGLVVQDTILWLYGSGFPKGRDQLKPAFEPICVAYKPGGQRTLQIDECRIALSNGDSGGNFGGSNKTIALESGRRMFNASPETRNYISEKHGLGRWPANVCHDGGDEVTAAFAVFGERASGSGDKHSKTQKGNIFHPSPISGLPSNGGDTGSAARFFYCAKADGEDRWGSRHPTVKPVELIKWLVALVAPPGGMVLDPFAGSGTTGVAALATGREAILIEREAEYQTDIAERLAYYQGDGRHSLAAKNRRQPARGLTGGLPGLFE